MTEPLCPALSCNVDDRDSSTTSGQPSEDDDLDCNVFLGCPSQISEITIHAVTFTSDHGVLKSYDKDWEDGGALFAKPHWNPKRSNPISHTGGKPLALKLEVEFGPPGAPAAEITVTGTQPHPRGWFERTLTVRPGTMEIELQSVIPLLDEVQDFELELLWRFKGFSESIQVTHDRTKHQIFVTMGQPSTPPSEPGITLKRMAHAVERVSSAPSNEPREIVRHVIQKFPSYDPMQVLDTAWRLADKSGSADCQTIVRYAQGVIQMVGCPGKNDFTVVWAKITSPAKGEVSFGYTPCMDPPRQYFNDQFTPRPDWEGVYGMLMDRHHVINRYEACLRFEHEGRVTFFGGGAGAYDDPNEVIGIFKAMVMVRDDPGSGHLKGIWYAYS